jgi:SAM-dependent methyltransferase
LIEQHTAAGSRLLEVGCGDGRLAIALSAAGYDVTAIDPRAPEGAIFRRERLDEFSAEQPFDAVVASVSLHHVANPAAAVAKIQELLEPGGLLLLDEFARERFEGSTARWYHERRRETDAAGTPEDFDEYIRVWQDDHDDVLPFEQLRAELQARLDEQFFERTPYLYDYHLGDELEPLERQLIDSGTIEPTGIRYVGQRR